MSRVMKRILFQVETYKGTEGLCNMICSQLNNEDINFGLCLSCIRVFNI